jgi:hypothetical protein
VCGHLETDLQCFVFFLFHIFFKYLTPWHRVFLEELIGIQPAKEYPVLMHAVVPEKPYLAAV